MNFSENFGKAKAFCSRRKKVIGIVVLLAVGLICATNEKANALLKQFVGVVRDVSGTEAAPSANADTNTTGTRKEDPVEAIFGPTAPQYSPTNHEGRAEEYRELEMKKLWEAVNKK